MLEQESENVCSKCSTHFAYIVKWVNNGTQKKDITNYGLRLSRLLIIFKTLQTLFQCPGQETHRQGTHYSAICFSNILNEVLACVDRYIGMMSQKLIIRIKTLFVTEWKVFFTSFKQLVILQTSLWLHISMYTQIYSNTTQSTPIFYD